MTDLIKREDVITVLYRNTPFDANGIALLDKCESEINAIPSADKPQGEWIFHYRDKWMVKAECPKCHLRFQFSPRTIWKCCPICETRIKGADDGTR